MARNGARVPVRGQTVPVDLAVVAAFSAAALSLVNVAVSARLSSRGRLDEWRRDEVKPLVARLVTLSQEASEKWQAAYIQRSLWWSSREGDSESEDRAARDQASEHWAKGAELYEKMRYELAQLDLVAGSGLRSAAAKLNSQHAAAWRSSRPSSGVSDSFKELMRLGSNIGIAENALVTAARHDLGLDRPGVWHDATARLVRWTPARKSVEAFHRSKAKPEFEREIV